MLLNHPLPRPQFEDQETEAQKLKRPPESSRLRLYPLLPIRLRSSQPLRGPASTSRGLQLWSWQDGQWMKRAVGGDRWAWGRKPPPGRL